MIEITAPAGPWKTRFIDRDGVRIARLRVIPHQSGYQFVALAGNIFTGRFGRTNTKHVAGLREARRLAAEI